MSGNQKNGEVCMKLHGPFLGYEGFYSKYSKIAECTKALGAVGDFHDGL